MTKRCDVRDFDFTTHANRGALLDFTGQVSPHPVLLGNGDADSRQWFAAKIRARHPQTKDIEPEAGKSVGIN